MIILRSTQQWHSMTCGPEPNDHLKLNPIMNVLSPCQEISLTSELAYHLPCVLCDPQLLKDIAI